MSSCDRCRWEELRELIGLVVNYVTIMLCILKFWSASAHIYVCESSAANVAKINYTVRMVVCGYKRGLENAGRVFCDLFLVRSGTPGPLHSAEHVAHTWVGSSQPPRRTCLPLASGVWPVQLCSPVSHPRMATKGGRALGSFACDIWLLVQRYLSSMDVNELCSYF